MMDLLLVIKANCIKKNSCLNNYSKQLFLNKKSIILTFCLVRRAF